MFTTFPRPLLLVFSVLLSGIRALTAAPDGKTFRLVSYNIHHGAGMDGKLDLNRIAALITGWQADAVVLQEVDRRCGRTGKVDQAAELGRLTRMTATFQKAMDYDGGEYGLCILTKMPPLETKGIPLPPGGEPRTGHWVRIPALGATLTLANTHLDFTQGPARLAQATFLLESLATAPPPVLLAGDFNAVRGDEVMTAVEAAGWAVPAKEGPAGTVPSQVPTREIDFAVYRPDSALRVVSYRVLDEAVASDHRPILIEVARAGPPGK